MYEIELKAHVSDRENTISLINSLCTFIGSLKKSDCYYKLREKNISCRIRKETSCTKKTTSTPKYYFTYKQKQRITDSNNSTYEVNNEYESEISNPQSIEKFLLDSGFEVSLTKSKDTLQWKKQTQFGEALIELCNIPPIGDFLELEIISNIDNNKEIQEELQKLILLFGLKLSDIEPKFYSELLNEVKSNS